MNPLYSAREHFLSTFLEEVGFIPTANGYQMRRVAPVVEMEVAAQEEDDEDA